MLHIILWAPHVRSPSVCYEKLNYYGLCALTRNIVFISTMKMVTVYCGF